MGWQGFNLRLSSLAVAMAATLVGASVANAAPEISFDDDAFSTSGTITHTAGGAIIGTNITFYSVTGFNTPTNNNITLRCNSGDGTGASDQDNPCLLNFETPVPTTEGDGTAGNDWAFGPGGSITITGILEVSEAGGTEAVGTQIVDDVNPILSGSFSSGSVSGSGNDMTFSSFGSDTKHVNLLEFYGLSNPFEFVSTKISLNNATFGPNAGDFSANVTNADLDNGPVGVPVPASLGLLGAGLIGLGVLTRRRSARD